MAAKKKWKTGIECRCGGIILCYVASHGEKYVNYNFECDGCKRDGKWNDLARGYFEYQRRTFE